MASIRVHGRSYDLVSQTDLTFGDLKKIEQVGRESGEWQNIEEWVAASDKASPLAVETYLWICVRHSDLNIRLEDLDDVPLSTIVSAAASVPKAKAAPRKGRTVKPKVDPTGTASKPADTNI